LLSDKIISGIIAIGSLFYSAIPGVNAEFLPIEFFPKGGALVINTQLDNCFSPELEEIILTGHPIRFHYTVQVLESGTDKVVVENSFYHEIRYYLLDKVYTVQTSENQKILETESFLRAQEYVTNLLAINAVTSDDIQFDKKYYVKIFAYLDKIFLPNLDKEIDLMFYWNKNKPEISSSFFNRSLITQ